MSAKLSQHLSTLPTPPKENLNSHFTLGEIIDHISILQEEFPHVKIPLLKTHLWSIRNKDVNPETHLRGFLKVFEDTDVFKDAFAELDEGMKRQIKVFIAGGTEHQIMAAGVEDGKFALPPSPPVKKHFKEMVEKLENFFKKEKKTNGSANGSINGSANDSINGSANGSINGSANGSINGSVNGSINGTANGHTNGHAMNGVIDPVKPLTQERPKESFPKIYEDAAETKTMEVYGDKVFQNWGQSVRNTPRWTFVPKTVLGLQNLVKWAKANNKRVRCSGYRHSWSSTFSQNDEILVSLLNLEEVTKLPDPMSIRPEFVDPENELKTITLSAPPGVVASGEDKALVRVGASVTNEQFRRWAVTNDKWTMPVDVILVE